MSETTFIQRIAEHIQSHYDLTRQEVTVVFPNKRAAFYLRKAIRQNGHSTFWLPQMISIEEAVTQWSGITMADNIDLLFELIDIDAELNKKKDSDLSIFGSKAAQMARDFDEIDQYGIDAKKVFQFVSDDKELRVWDINGKERTKQEKDYLQFFQSLNDYYLQLRNRLFQQGKGYYGMITRLLAEKSEDELLACIGDAHILFAGFNALTSTEKHIIETLARNGRAEIIFDYDNYYVDDPNNEVGLFARKYRKDHPDWLIGGLSDNLTTEPKTIHIISASGNALQTKALQAKLQETQNEKQAVILADENLLIPTLNSIPESYPDFKVSMGYPLTMTPVNQLVKMQFMLFRRHNRYIWPIFHLMDLEIVKIIFPTSELEVFSLWKRQVVKAGKFIFEDRDLEDLQQIPSIQKFLSLILDSINASISEQILDSIIKVLAFVAQQIQLADEESRNIFLLNQVSEVGKIVSRLQSIIGRNARYVKDPLSLEALYRVLTSASSLKLESSNTEGLQIMGILETRNLDFHQFHLLSVNEGVMPPDKSRSSFIPQFIRRACGLPGYLEGQAVVAYHFYRLLQNGSDIYLYYNNLGDTSGGEPSRFILQIKHELARKGNITIVEETFASKSKSSLDPKPLSAQKTYAIERLSHLIGERGLSPSALSTYLNCPLKYFLHYIAQIEDNSVEEDLGSNEVGTVIHDTLELLFANYLPKDGRQQIIDKALFDQTILPCWQEKLTEAIAHKFPYGFPNVGFNYLNRITMEQQLKNYMSYTSRQLEDNTLTLLETECELRAKLSTSNGNCFLFGRADRIDRLGEIIRVIDYKTGRVNNSDLLIPVRHQDESEMEYLKKIPEKALQLLIYKYLYLRTNRDISPDQVTAAIHALRNIHNVEFNITQATAKKDETNINADFLSEATFMADMETLLSALVVEMLDPETPFTQTVDDKQCRNCDFKEICKR